MGHIFERIKIFYHVVLKISRLANRIFVKNEICIAGLFSQNSLTSNLVMSNCLLLIVIQNYIGMFDDMLVAFA